MSVLKITKDNFENEVLNSEKTVLLDFYADWCGPCRMVGPVIEEIAKEHFQGQIFGGNEVIADKWEKRVYLLLHLLSCHFAVTTQTQTDNTIFRQVCQVHRIRQGTLPLLNQNG